MSLTQIRVFQYVVLLLLFSLIGAAGYAYFKSRAAQSITDNRPSFEAPLTHTLNLSAGIGAPSFSRSDGADRRATVTDFEGLIRSVKNNEARFEGARRVENLVSTKSEDWSNAAWSKTTMTASATTLEATSGNATCLQTLTAASADYRLRVKMSRVTGTGNIQLTIDGSTWTTVTLTGGDQVFSVSATGVTNPNFGIRVVTSGDKINATQIQLEDVTGQSNQNPSEYVSCGVKTSAPYHGADVDCVKYFNTQNGNTVSSNVVTEATGSAISDSTLKGYLAEGSRTNLLLRSEEFDSASWTTSNVTMTANAVTAPNGKTTADKVEATTATNTSFYQTVSTTGTSATCSVYIKKGSGATDANRFILRNNTTATNLVGVTINYDTLDFSYDYGSTGATLTNVGNGWARLALSVTSGITSGDSIRCYEGFMGNSESAGEYVYIWGAQLEMASFASTYIPTTSASVTRAGDALMYPSTSFGDQTGSVTLETRTKWSTNPLDKNAPWLHASSTQIIGLWSWTGADNNLIADRGSVGQRNNTSAASLSVTTAETLMRIGMRYDDTDVRAYRDGTKISTATKNNPYATFSTIYIGGNGPNMSVYATIKNVRAWNQAMSDTFLQDLTAGKSGTIKQATGKAPNNTGLVGYWSFEDGSSTTATDFSGSGNKGTLVNMEEGDWADGKLGKALSFDGVDEKVTTALDVGGLDSKSFAGWFYIDSTTSNTAWLPLVGEGTSFDSNKYSGIFTSENSKLQCYQSYNSGNSTFYADVTSNAAVPTDQWFYVACTIDKASNSLNLYYNGSLIATRFPESDLSSATFYNPTQNTQINSNGTGTIGFTWKGKADDVKVYNRALSQDEITQLYQSSLSTKVNVSQNDKSVNGLVGLWSFNGQDLSGTTAYDRSGQGNNGTLTNGPTIIEGKVGQALNFDGTNDSVTLADSSAFDFWGTGTVCGWFYTTQNLTGKGMISHTDSVSPGTYKWIAGYISSNGGTLSSYVRVGGVAYNASTGPGTAGYYANAWHHTCLTFDRTLSSGRLKVYVDGAFGNSANAVDGDVDTGDLPQIGKWGASNYFPGIIDEIRIYNRALSSSEVLDIYNQGR